MDDNAPLSLGPPIWGRRFESDRLFVELCPRQPYQVQYRPDWHILGFALESQAGYHAFASDRIAPYYAPANTYAFTPADCDTFSESSRGGAYLIFALSPEFFSFYESDIATQQTVSLRRLSHIRNPHVTAIGRAARQFMQTHSFGGRLYLEALAGQFATHAILALLSKPEITAPSCKLCNNALAQLTEYVTANLCEDLSINSLAEVVNMSPSSFVRTFKAVVGDSPHAWVITHRITRAKALLVNTELPIAQIALDCGFSSQSHMTTLFSRRLGITPRQYRKIVNQ